MSSDEMIECTYGHHKCAKSEFSASGIDNGYYSICRNCNNERMRKYREKHNEKYNNSRREYNRNWMSKWRKDVKEIKEANENNKI